jgi:hypothetical protein
MQTGPIYTDNRILSSYGIAQETGGKRKTARKKDQGLVLGNARQQ